MSNLTVNEEALHYAARFLERWAEKSPNREHDKMARQLREVSDYLIDNLYQPMFLTVVRARKK